MRTCYRCEYTIDIEKRVDSLYCSEQCRQAHADARKYLLKKLRASCDGLAKQQVLELEIIGQKDLDKFLKLTPAINVDSPAISRDEAIELGIDWDYYWSQDGHTVSQRLLKSDTDIEAARITGWDEMEAEATEMMNQANGLVVNSLIGHPQDELLVDNDPEQI
jgi:hypothetical protein